MYLLTNLNFFLARSCSLVLFGFSQINLTDTCLSPLCLPETITLATIIGWGVPTILTIFAFSIFTYYIAKLNSLIEKNGSRRDTGKVLTNSHNFCVIDDRVEGFLPKNWGQRKKFAIK